VGSLFRNLLQALDGVEILNGRPAAASGRLHWWNQPASGGGNMNILVVVLIVGLVLALALWIVSLPANVPAYTRPIFDIALIVAALIVVLMHLPA
jgi:hypothetical protein